MVVIVWKRNLTCLNGSGVSSRRSRMYVALFSPMPCIINTSYDTTPNLKKSKKIIKNIKYMNIPSGLSALPCKLIKTKTKKYVYEWHKTCGNSWQ